MTFKDIKNNDMRIRRLQDAISKGNILHAYIFEGGTREDRSLAADCFAKAVLCGVYPGAGCDYCKTCKKIDHGNHEDIIRVEKDENSVKDEYIAELQSKLLRKPFSGERSIAIINDSETMTKWAYNRLLKTLEEPPPGTVIILLADSVEKITETIVSRCAVLKWNPFAECDPVAADKAEELIKTLLDGEPFYSSKKKLTSLAENRDEAYKLLDAMEVSFGKLIRGSGGGKAVKTAIGRIEEARSDLVRGMQVGYTLKRMLLNMEDI